MLTLSVSPEPKLNELTRLHASAMESFRAKASVSALPSGSAADALSAAPAGSERSQAHSQGGGPPAATYHVVTYQPLGLTRR